MGSTVQVYTREMFSYKMRGSEVLEKSNLLLTKTDQPLLEQYGETEPTSIITPESKNLK